jgi:hypothetical protein
MLRAGDAEPATLTRINDPRHACIERLIQSDW